MPHYTQGANNTLVYELLNQPARLKNSSGSSRISQGWALLYAESKRGGGVVGMSGRGRTSKAVASLSEPSFLQRMCVSACVSSEHGRVL